MTRSFRRLGALALAVATPAFSGDGCNPADLAPPFGVLDLGDINAFTSGFLAGVYTCKRGTGYSRLKVKDASPEFIMSNDGGP